MSAILTAPITVAAFVLGVAGVAKLRAPGGARRALATAGLSMTAGGVRVIASSELALAGFALLAPGRAASAVIAAMYALLALVAYTLARRGAACGCFGGDDTPATATHVWLSAAIALIAGAGVAAPPHGIAWLLTGSAEVIGPLALGIAGATYATVIAYTELPAAWTAWRPR